MLGGAAFAAQAQPEATTGAAPAPLEQAVAADWIVVFKFNARDYPSGGSGVKRDCPFGGSPVAYPGAFSQAYAAATSARPHLEAGPGLAGTGLNDPLGATFAKIWNGNYNYVVWNDQFYKHPPISGCAESCGAPWGHSKGILAWTDAGEGLLLQVTTPSWPAAGSKANPRPGDGNTLGCIVRPNNLKFSQHFFALRLSAGDVGKVLDSLANASVVTDLANPVLVRNGGPAAIRAKVALLGKRSPSRAILDYTLSTGVRLISKPSALNVPPWQMVSAKLGGVALRAATWWAAPKIPSTTAASKIVCWDPALPKPGPVEIATSGHWDGKEIDLKGGSGNHGKIGVSIGGTHPYAIFADMNQQGALSGKCSSSQNGRGGLFFVVENAELHDSVQALIKGGTAPAAQ
ncbi:MAG TPA: deoxyribonuclease II family protein [Allosphingosinicella sp.]|nr:deoxyribonuclease II family protein [Allosphingosinicella sp.]